MNISYKWLQDYFEKPLPSVEELSDLLTVRAFEIEETKEVGSDYMIDVDVLPNRAHDCLCHRGIAKDVAVLTNVKMKEQKAKSKDENQNEKNTTDLEVDVQESKLCKRYIGKKINNISVGESPDWLKEKLEVIGQKSINSVVDAANYVMFDMGQPMHAFDTDKVEGSIVVRMAREGESIETLDGQMVALNENVLIIADEKDPLAIAGIKGGKKAEVDENTKNVILEAANFDSTNIRKTTRIVNIQTDASKRFENEITHEYAPIAIDELAAMIVEISGNNDTEIEARVDVNSVKDWQYKVGVSKSEVNNLLGADLSESEIEDIFTRFGWKFEKVNPREKVIAEAEKLVGTTYKRPSSMRADAPEAFSCTSLISYVFTQAGIWMPSISVDKFVYGEPIEESDLQEGDVVFVNTGEGTGGAASKIYTETIEWLPKTQVPEGVDHAGIYMGDGKVLHTTWKHGKALIEELGETDQFKNIVGYRNFIGNGEERYVVSVPAERLDIRIKEDLIEEIGRVYGYENLKVTPLSLDSERVNNKRLYYANRIRTILQRLGYTEQYGYTFRAEGEVEIAKALAQDKNFLRTSLEGGIQEALDLNDKNKDLLGLDRVRIFEFGTVFSAKSESHHFAIGLSASKQKKEEDVLAIINTELGTKLSAEIFTKAGGVFETNFDELITTLPDVNDVEVYENTLGDQIAYKKISAYPFIARDIAVWTPESTTKEDVENIIFASTPDRSIDDVSNVVAPLVRIDLFDEFQKEGRVSFAFHLVFQAPDRTLTDDEVNDVMQKIESEMNNKDGWEVR